jgi:hypothetical protein
MTLRCPTRGIVAWSRSTCLSVCEALLGIASVVVGAEVNKQLGLVTLGVATEAATVDADGVAGAPASWSATVRSQTLLGFAYYEFATLMFDPMPLRRCEEVTCGRLFEVTDPRKRFHSPECNYKSRRRRWREKGRKDV